MRLLIVLICFVVTLQTISATSCICENVIPPYSLHDQYCESSYMIRAHILSDLITPDDPNAKPYYDIRILNRYKEPEGVNFPQMANVTLDIGSASCDSIKKLKYYKVYLLAGQVDNGMPLLGGCSTFYAKYPLESKYKKLAKNPSTCLHQN